MNFFGSELQLRGSAPIVQPHTENGNVFCWNGEVSFSMLIVPGARLNCLPEDLRGLGRESSFFGILDIRQSTSK